MRPLGLSILRMRHPHFSMVSHRDSGSSFIQARPYVLIFNESVIADALTDGRISFIQFGLPEVKLGALYSPFITK